MSELETFPDRLRTAMEAKKLTPETLHLACDKAFAVRSIYRWRQGKSVPGVEALPILAPALAVSADWLTGVSDEGGPIPLSVSETP